MSGLNRSDINEILGYIENSNFTELRIEAGDLKIELRRAGAASPLPVTSALQTSEAPPPAPVAPQTQPAMPVATSGTVVPAPMLGIFYHAPKPGDEPFVKPGDIVSADTVIGIIEVMKLMNRVSAGISGIVTEVVAPSGELVEHGDPLIRVKVD